MIGVLGGTGMTGRHVVAGLKAKGAAFVCIVRDRAKAGEMLGAEVETVQGDFSDPSSLDSAFKGLDTLYLLCGHSPKLAESEINAIEAAKRAGIGYIVKSSASEKGVSPDAPSAILRSHYTIEQALKQSGIRWAVSRPNFFMSNLLNMAPPIAQDSKLVTALPPETVISMIHPADVGECGAELLTVGGHEGEALFLTGTPVTMAEVREELSRVLGRDIAYVQVSVEALREALTARGLPDWLIDHQAALMGFVADGAMQGETDWVQKLTGHPPRPLADWIGENRAVLGG